ncbi:MAG: GSCFA family protein [Idiomarina sp.]|nr:GSCFA family protein [Idiomarina sp.]
MSRKHPYLGKPNSAFWKKSISNVHYSDIGDLCRRIPISSSTKVATAGSCFAQHIGHNLKKRGANYLDFEPAPDFLDSKNASRWGFGAFSCRYGNIYTSRQLLQLFKEAFGLRVPLETCWAKKDRFVDAFRPSVEPVGLDSVEAVIAQRKIHLKAVRDMFTEVDFFVFTLGLTECWSSLSDFSIYPTAPGTLAGKYSEDKYSFVNLTYEDVLSDMIEFKQLLSEVNPSCKLLLTVSPVPLAATASDDHVLIATTYSKSVLRAVAGYLSNKFDDIFYFPSFEIITSSPFRSTFFESDLREVNSSGVELVMQHFFNSIDRSSFTEVDSDSSDDYEIVCDEDESINRSI